MAKQRESSSPERPSRRRRARRNTLPSAAVGTVSQGSHGSPKVHKSPNRRQLQARRNQSLSAVRRATLNVSPGSSPHQNSNSSAGSSSAARAAIANASFNASSTGSPTKRAPAAPAVSANHGHPTTSSDRKFSASRATTTNASDNASHTASPRQRASNDAVGSTLNRHAASNDLTVGNAGDLSTVRAEAERSFPMISFHEAMQSSFDDEDLVGTTSANASNYASTNAGSTDSPPKRAEGVTISPAVQKRIPSASSATGAGSTAFGPIRGQTRTITRRHASSPTRPASGQSNKPAQSLKPVKPPRTALPPPINMTVGPYQRKTNLAHRPLPKSRRHIQNPHDVEEAWLNDHRNLHGKPWPGMQLERKIEEGKVRIVEHGSSEKKKVVRTVPSKATSFPQPNFTRAAQTFLPTPPESKRGSDSTDSSAGTGSTETTGVSPLKSKGRVGVLRTGEDGMRFVDFGTIGGHGKLDSHGAMDEGGEDSSDSLRSLFEDDGQDDYDNDEL